jgi:type I restriction enzyme S subunit
MIDRRFLARYMLKPEVVAFITSRSTGANLPRIAPKELATLQIPLPNVSEQRRIAAILDCASSLRSKRRVTMEQAEKLEVHLFLEMFDQFTRPGTTVRDLVAKTNNSVRTGPFGSQLLHSEFTDQGVAVLGLDNVIPNTFRWSGRRYVTDAKFAQLKRYQVFPGDVLISIMGTCGRCAIVPESIPLAINTKHLCCITLDRSQMIPEFLRAYFLYHPVARSYLSQKTKGAIMAGLNMGIILDTPVAVPPMAEQRRYAQALCKFGAVSANLEESSIQLDALFASLQARAFAGEL